MSIPTAFDVNDARLLLEVAGDMEQRIMAAGPHESTYERTLRPQIVALTDLATRINMFAPESYGG